MTKNVQPYTTYPDYILGITYEIWEERGINKIRNYYHKDTIVRSADGVVTGNENVIKATQETLAEFPDRVLLGEDVIWAQTGKIAGSRPIGFCPRQPIGEVEDLDIQAKKKSSIEPLQIATRSKVLNLAG